MQKNNISSFWKWFWIMLAVLILIPIWYFIITIAGGSFFEKKGNKYYYKDKYAKAIAAYKTSLKLNSNNVDVYNNLGYSYYELHEYKKALGVYEKALSLDPKHIYVHYNMGLLYTDMHEYKKAKNAYMYNIRKNPSDNSAEYLAIFELELIQDEPFSVKLEEDFLKYFKDNEEDYIDYEMLQLLYKISIGTDVDILKWDNDYKDISTNWLFGELDTWIITIKDESIKLKLEEALIVIKAHKND